MPLEKKSKHRKHLCPQGTNAKPPGQCQCRAFLPFTYLSSNFYPLSICGDSEGNLDVGRKRFNLNFFLWLLFLHMAWYVNCKKKRDWTKLKFLLTKVSRSFNHQKEIKILLATCPRFHPSRRKKWTPPNGCT